ADGAELGRGAGAGRTGTDAGSGRAGGTGGSTSDRDRDLAAVAGGVAGRACGNREADRGRGSVGGEGARPVGRRAEGGGRVRADGSDGVRDDDWAAGSGRDGGDRWSDREHAGVCAGRGDESGAGGSEW